MVDDFCKEFAKVQEINLTVQGFYLLIQKWDWFGHVTAYVLFKQNIGSSFCIDETSLSCGGLYSGHQSYGPWWQGRTCIRDTRHKVWRHHIRKVFEMIHLSRHKTVKEVTLALSPTMMRIVRTAFPNAIMTNGRFHVQKSHSDIIRNWKQFTT